MPPKKQNNEEEASLKDVLAELAEIKAKLSKFESLETKIDRLQTQLEEITTENKQLKDENTKLRTSHQQQSATINELRTNLDGVERHQRSWSIRVNNIPLSDAEERDPSLTMKKVYDLLLHPILVGARERGAVRAVPDCDQLLETAHVLPGRPGSAKPIIVRFAKRPLRAICFRHRKEFAPTTTSRGDPDRERQLYPFHDDLTRAAAHKMSEIQADPSVQACWSINGQLRFKLKDSDRVKRVKSVFDDLETILSYN